MPPNQGPPNNPQHPINGPPPPHPMAGMPPGPGGPPPPHQGFPPQYHQGPHGGPPGHPGKSLAVLKLLKRLTLVLQVAML